MMTTTRSASVSQPQPVPSSSARSHRDRPSYFPPQPPLDSGAQTLSNTLLNSGMPLAEPTPLSFSARQGKFTEEWEAAQRGSSILSDGNMGSAFPGSQSLPNPSYVQQPQAIQQQYGQTPNGASPAHPGIHRSHSFAPSIAESNVPSRGNTLKKKPSVRRTGSLKRSGSKRSMKAGSVRSLALQSSSDPDELHSAFYCPVPTQGNPTEILAHRFNAWRKLLKDLITHFKEIQVFYESRGKSLLRLSNDLGRFSTPPGFLSSGGLDDALQILRGYNRMALQESQRAREIEEDVINALTGLRHDLGLKVKEIKSLSGDFKNNVDKEMEATRRAVNNLQDVLGQTELDASLTTGKQDPYLLRLAVDRQLEKQIDEENYLHQAYANLEKSGRELESIVVGEIQKSYNAFASILKREADIADNAVDELRSGPIAMPKDYEWSAFISRDDQFVDPSAPMREVQYIHYPGKDHDACQEIRAGLLERKSKYLKSYAAGWYVLSPTHLHEFRSADKTGAPLMSLYLPEQKLGSHSTEGGSSNKFIIKGRQTGSMHRGHTWVFRAESHDTMMAWYEDIKVLTEKTPQERSDFLRSHSRAGSRASARGSFSSDGVADDDDEAAFGASNPELAAAAGLQAQNQGSMMAGGLGDQGQPRPTPGGRFPSDDLAISPTRGVQQGPMSPDTISSTGFEASIPAMAGIPVTTNSISGYAPERTKSPRMSLISNSQSLQQVPTPGQSIPGANQGYADAASSHPNFSIYTSGTNDVLPAQHAQLQHLQAQLANQNPRTPSPRLQIATLTKDTTTAAAPARTGIDGTGFPNGATAYHRLSYVGSDRGSEHPPESPAIKAAVAVMGRKNAGSMSSTVVNRLSMQMMALDSGSEAGSIRSPKTSKKSKRESLRRERPTPVERTGTTQTISGLHIPGEFPRGMSS